MILYAPDEHRPSRVNSDVLGPIIVGSADWPAGETVTLKDIEAARRAHRRALRVTINDRVARVVDFLPVPSQRKPQVEEPKPSGRSRVKLRIYQEE